MDYLTDEQRDLRNKILYTGAGLAALGGLGYGLHKLTKKPASAVVKALASPPPKPVNVKTTKTPAQTKADYLKKNISLIELRAKAAATKSVLEALKQRMLKDKAVLTAIDYKKSFYQPLVKQAIAGLGVLPLPDQVDILYPFMSKRLSHVKLVEGRATLDDMVELITNQMIYAAHKARK